MIRQWLIGLVLATPLLPGLARADSAAPPAPRWLIARAVNGTVDLSWEAVTIFVPPPFLTFAWPDRGVTDQPSLRLAGRVETGATATLYRDDQVLVESIRGSFQTRIDLVRGTNELRLVAVLPDGTAVETSRTYVYQPPCGTPLPGYGGRA